MDNSTAVIGLNLIRQQIHEYVAMNFLFDGSSGPLDDDMPLAENNVLDQTGVLELVLFLEETYGIQVDDADLTPENFDSVNAIADYAYLRLANA
ncbi:MAG TPA: acyl carrier protein [Ktedonobacterales bacterium]|jgi:acyl carrier protein|nr:acyl carrier protein [Ktedonobacterales bacterium]HEX5570349.1 acyl carrier protein [Ktedonobacterales bacterium]